MGAPIRNQTSSGEEKGYINRLAALEKTTHGVCPEGEYLKREGSFN